MDFQNIYNLIVEKLTEWIKIAIVMLPNFIVAALIVFLAFLIAKIIRKFSNNVLGRISHHQAVTNLISQALFIIIIAVGVFVALGVLKQDKAVTSLLAGAGIIGLALGFAFQDLAANFLAGVVIAISRPFRVGDIIESNDHTGIVKKINLRTTDIMTFQGQFVLIPNKEVFQKPLKNFSITGQRRVDLKVGISYGEDLEKVKKIAIDSVENVANRIKEREIEFFFEEFGDSSINFEIRIWARFFKQTDFLRSRSEMVMNIKKAFDQNGIVIPFPIRTLDFGIKGGEKLSEMKVQISNDKRNGE